MCKDRPKPAKVDAIERNLGHSKCSARQQKVIHINTMDNHDIMIRAAESSSSILG